MKTALYIVASVILTALLIFGTIRIYKKIKKLKQNSKGKTVEGTFKNQDILTIQNKKYQILVSTETGNAYLAPFTGNTTMIYDPRFVVNHGDTLTVEGKKYQVVVDKVPTSEPSQVKFVAIAE